MKAISDILQTISTLTLSLAVFIISPTAAGVPPIDPAGHHLTIWEVAVDFDENVSLYGQLTIRGTNFDLGNSLVVTLGEAAVPLVIVSATGTEIVADLPGPFPAGDYLLTVSAGPGEVKNDEYDLTLTLGPAGPTLSVIELDETCTVANGAFSVCAKQCPDDRVPTGGGFFTQGMSGANNSPHPVVHQSNRFFNGWVVAVFNDLGTDLDFKVFVECAKLE